MMESTIKAQAQTIIELQELVASVDSVWGLIGCLKNGKMVYGRDGKHSTKTVGVSFLVEATRDELTEIEGWKK